MMTILSSARWTTFLDCVGSMETRWLLPHTPLWGATLRHIFTSPLTPQWMASFKRFISSSCSTWTCTRQSWWQSPLDVILSMGCMISSSWRKPMDTYLTPHRLSHRPWVSTQSAMDNAYHTIDHLIPLGTSSTLCELINLIHSWLNLDQSWIFPILFIWMMSRR